MSLYNMIKKLKDDARKARETNDVTFYSTLQGELERVAKEPNDEQSLKVLGKILQSNKDGVTTAQTLWENVILENLIETFTPVQITEGDIKLTIRKIREDNPSAGIREIMTYFKENHAGHYDAKLVSQLAK
jgi:uncharacterized protein YqeY